jgi:WD40 repeat protein
MLRTRSWFLLLTLALIDATAMAQPKQPRLDRHGDPLPDGALLRIGTVRLRSGGRIDSLAFSSDGSKIITAERMSGVHVWDVVTGKELRALPCLNKDEPRWHAPSPFATILLSPHGTHVAEVNNQSICSVREIASGKELWRVDRKHWQNLCHLRFAPDGKTLALLANANGEVTIYDVASGELLHTLPKRHDACYPFLAFGHDGKSLAVAAQNIPVIHYDVLTGKRLGEFSDVRDGSFGSGVFSPDGKRFAFFSKYYRCLEVWDVATYKRLTAIDGAFNSSQLIFSPDSRWIISAYENAKLGIWEADTGKLVRTQPDRFGGFWHTAVSRDGKMLATAHGPIVELWRLDTGKPLHNFAGHAGHSINVQFGTDSKTLISISPGRVHGSDTTAYIWDALTGKRVADVSWAGGDWPVGAVSANGRMQAEGRGGEKTIVRELATKRVLLQIEEPTYIANQVALTPAGTHLLVTLHQPISNGRSKVQLWEVVTGKKLLELNEPCHAEIDVSGARLLIYCNHGEARQLQCYDVATGRPAPRARMKVPTHSVVLSPNGRLTAEAPWPSNSIKLRELATGEVVAEFGGGRALGVATLAFSPNGRLLAAGTTEGAILIWDIIHRRELAHLTGHRSWISALSWAPDGKRLASSSQDLTMLVWDAEAWRVEATDLDGKLSPQNLAALWDDLGILTGDRGYRAVHRLAHAPKDAVALLGKKLQPTTPEEAARVRTLISQLDDVRFSVRTKAHLELETLGDLAIPGLEKALATVPTLETRLRIERLFTKLRDEPPPTAHMQQLRALTVLEMAGTRDADALLHELSGGAPESWLTREAHAAKSRRINSSGP